MRLLTDTAWGTAANRRQQGSTTCHTTHKVAGAEVANSSRAVSVCCKGASAKCALNFISCLISSSKLVCVFAHHSVCVVRRPAVFS